MLSDEQLVDRVRRELHRGLEVLDPPHDLLDRLEQSPPAGRAPAFRRGRRVMRAIPIALAAIVAVVVGAIALTELHRGAAGPGSSGGLVTQPAAGAPETILMLGTDHLPGRRWVGNTDTIMLIRLDPASQTVNVLSIPRDLEVTLPGIGAAKLNAAYAAGGAALLIDTLQTQVLPGLVVNHVVLVSFSGFQKLVDAIGCVYGDIDHRYYNNTAVTDYASIDIQPGYQKLCGAAALAFVRFRHTDTDIVRNARQQDLIRWAKQSYSASQLLANATRLFEIFGKYAQTDAGLHTTHGLLSLFDILVNVQGHAIKSIPFPYTFGPCATGSTTPCYLHSTEALAQAAYGRFMTPTPAPAPSDSPAASSATQTGTRPQTSPDTSGLEADPGDGRTQAAQLGNIGMPIYYPEEILARSRYCKGTTGNCDAGGFTTQYANSYPRAYTLPAPDGTTYPAYRMTLVADAATGGYYGVQGTTWMNPPILKNPTLTRTIAGKRLEEFLNGGKLSVVAWRTPHAVYWISNTLTDTITNSQLIAIAASLTSYTG